MPWNVPSSVLYEQIASIYYVFGLTFTESALDLPLNRNGVKTTTAFLRTQIFRILCSAAAERGSPIVLTEISISKPWLFHEQKIESL